MKICSICGAEIADNEKICSACGAEIPAQEAAPETEAAAAATEETAPETAGETADAASDADSEFAKLVSEADAENGTEAEGDNAKTKKKNKKLTVIIAVLLVVIAGLLGIFGAGIYSYIKANKDTAEKKTVDYVAKASKKAGFPQVVYSETFGTADGVDVPRELLEVAYLDQVNSVMYANDYYDSSYGEGYGKMFTGFDPSVSAALQSTQDDENNTVTFDEYWLRQAAAEIERVLYIYKTGNAAGYTLSDGEKSEVNNAVSYIIDGTGNAAVNIFDYLTGKGLSAKKAAAVITQYYYLISYADAYSKDAADNVEIADADIEAYISEHADEFKVADIYVLSLGTSDLEDPAAVIAECQEKAVDFDSFRELALSERFGLAEDEFESSCFSKATQRSTISSYVNDETADWMFSAERKEGDCLVVDLSENGGFYVFCVAKPVYENNENLPSIRVIPVFDSEGTAASEDLKAKADECVAAYNNGDKTEESFIELVKLYSCDADTTANEGLMENLERGQFLPDIENWAYDAARQKGDITTIELSNGGYCIMYFIGAEHTAAFTAATDSLKSDKAEALKKEWEDAYKGSFVIDDAAALDLRADLLNYVESIIRPSAEEGTTAA